MGIRFYILILNTILCALTIQATEYYIPVEYKESQLNKLEIDFENILPFQSLIIENESIIHIQTPLSDPLINRYTTNQLDYGYEIILDDIIPFNAFSFFEKFISNEDYNNYSKNYSYKIVKYDTTIKVTVYDLDSNIVKTQVLTRMFDENIPFDYKHFRKLKIVGKYRHSLSNSIVKFWYDNKYNLNDNGRYDFTSGDRKVDFEGKIFYVVGIKFTNSDGKSKKYALEVTDNGATLNLYDFDDSNIHKFKLFKKEFSLIFVGR